MVRIRSRIAQLSSRAQSTVNREAVFQRFLVEGALFAFAVAGNTWPLRSVLSCTRMFHVFDSVAIFNTAPLAGRVPGLCNAPVAGFYRKADVSRRLHEAGTNIIPSCIDITGWYHFLSITVPGEDAAELEQVYERLVTYARTVMAVAFAADVAADEDTFTAITAQWPDAILAEIAGRVPN